MTTWVLLIVIYTQAPAARPAGFPAGITSVSGYTSLDDCAKAAEFLNKLTQLEFMTAKCIPGPSR
jgi:hypothetical protein